MVADGNSLGQEGHSMSDAPTTKRRMGIPKKVGIGAGVALGCLVLAALVLVLLAARWEARIKPLSLGEVRTLRAAGDGGTRESAGQGGKEEGDHDRRSGSRDGASGENDEADGAASAASHAGDASRTSDGAGGPEPIPPKEMRLAALPTQAQLDWFKPVYSGSELTKMRLTKGFITKVILTAFYNVGVPEADSIPGDVGQFYFAELRDFDTARPWLAEGIRATEDRSVRRSLCAMEAWLVDDPQVAAALLEESLSGPATFLAGGEDQTPFVALNAVDLCIVTGSDELAEYYYERYRDQWPEWVKNFPHYRDHWPVWFSRFPGFYNMAHLETAAWLENHEANARHR